MSNNLLPEFNLGIAVLTVQFITEIYWMNYSTCGWVVSITLSIRRRHINVGMYLHIPRNILVRLNSILTRDAGGGSSDSTDDIKFTPFMETV